jgi:signal transduction histidine kinase
MVNQLKWYFHPVTVFIFSVLALTASLFLYIYWYVEVSMGLKEVVRNYNLDATRTDQLEYIDFMIRDVNRLSDNIGRILDLARIESRSYGGEFVKENPVQTTKEFLKSNTHIFHGCDIEVHDPPAGNLYCSLNRPLFEMLLMNLITNAVKYNRSEKPRIDIRFVPRKRRLQVRFEDNGIGIAKKETKKIFRKFYQVGRSEDMTARGSGLGLYLVKHIARIHKGKIGAESRGIGKGSTFTLTLPLQKSRVI